MKIRTGDDIARNTTREKENLEDYMNGLALWTYTYIESDNTGLLTRIRAQYSKNGKVELNKQGVSAEEIGIIALASRYAKGNGLESETETIKLAEFQFILQSYLGIIDNDIVRRFYDDLVESVKPEHNELIPTLHVFHAQIHALKIAYESLKPKMNKAGILTRVIFGLVCIELMKLKVRLYLVEPIARTEIGKNLDWIYMLDMVFDDFSFQSPYNRDSIRKKSVPSIDFALESKLQEAMRYIKGIRDQVQSLKDAKAKGAPHKSSSTVAVSPEIVAKIKARILNGTNPTQSPPSA